MSLQAIQKYYTEVERIIRFGGTRKETAIRTPFINLINDYAYNNELTLVPEYSIKLNGRIITPDGTLKDALQQAWGYYESKDEDDDLNEEIEKKFAKGYPNDNILFEDSVTAVLFQAGVEVMRIKIEDELALDRLLKSFTTYEKVEVTEFRQAIEFFKQDVPKVTDTIKGIIQAQEKTNAKFIKAQDNFIELCRESINPEISKIDIQEMMVQHILTAEIFNTIFDEAYFHRENNIAKELEKVLDTFFTGATRRLTLDAIKHYYQAINAAAHNIANHHEKQKFLKIIYETFYKSYNPKAADKLGVVYTPNEIVKFMIESTDYLLQKHFNKMLQDKGVEILDPATGTGTFICDIIDYIHPNKLEYKYKHELHANEVAILPYYIANLNIEFTYKQKMKKHEEYKNLCFVDTLDNMGFSYKGKQTDIFGMSAENALRIKKQNDHKISVIIGNPPYNANQQNENDNNKNRSYPLIDKRIKDTFIKQSSAQKTKVYDMYARFYRWAMDRVGDDGVITMITNNSFINSRTFDGFRKIIENEFSHAYIIDLGGNIRELSGKDGIFLNEKHTIFGQSAAVGIAMMFLIKDSSAVSKKCYINYIHPCDIRATRDEKISFLQHNKITNIDFEKIKPDKNNNWINLVENDFDTLLPICSKEAKAGKSEKAIFKLFSLGTTSNRDEWVYSFDEKNLKLKINFFVKQYKEDLRLNKKNKGFPVFNSVIKYTRDLKKRGAKLQNIEINKNEYRDCHYRVFTKLKLYYGNEVNEMRYQTPLFFPTKDTKNTLIAINSSSKPFNILASNTLVDLHFNGDSQCLALYTYNASGERLDNITNWGLAQFTAHYNNAAITKQDVFNYCYAVLHNPAYRSKYELNLKRDFPRIPLYTNFDKWVAWGKQLMDLHINYETVAPFKLKEITNLEISKPKAKLKADKTIGTITIDDATELTGIPPQAWEYKLGNRSAIEWVLDQYKEKKPTDPTLLAHFNTYQFADYKTHVIDLLMRVSTVSVQTMAITNAMQNQDLNTH